jgi:hypothetical protein
MNAEGKRDKSAFMNSLNKEEKESCKSGLVLLFGENEKYKRGGYLLIGRLRKV